jgi:hypothetical protein
MIYKKKSFIYVAIFFWMLCEISIFANFPQQKTRHAITYRLESWRRLGDTILTYTKAKLLAYTYNLDFFYKSFPYSDQFILHETEKQLTLAMEQKFSKTIEVLTLQDLEDNLASDQPILFECQFLTQTPWPYIFSREHPDFEKQLKEMLTPVTSLPSLPKPPAVVSVAVHVRKGGGFDHPLGSLQEYQDNESITGFHLKKNNIAGSCTDIWPLKWNPGPRYIESVKKFVQRKTQFSDYIWPTKFPSDQYYIDHIKKLAEMLPGKNLLIYLFTDDPNPQAIMQRYSKALEDYPRIIFSFREQENRHNKNVLDDLFAIAQCDCIISANSSFAFAAHLLGNHSIIMFPIHAITLPDKIIMNKVAVATLENPYDLKKRKIFYNEWLYKLK